MAIFAGGLPLAALAACQLFVNSDVYQCTTDADCTSRFPEQTGVSCSVDRVCVVADAATDANPPPDTGTDAGGQDADTDGPFSCANDPPPEPKPGVTVNYTRFFQDVAAGTALLDIGIEVCALFDVTCSAPRKEDGGIIVVPDDAGKVTVTVEYGFNGLLQVTDLFDAGDGGPKVVTPALIQVTPPVVQPDTVGPPALMVSPSVFDSVANTVFGGGTADPTLAHVFFRTNDCHQQPLKDITVAAGTTGPKTTKVFYFDGLVPDTTFTATDATGKGGILNLPPGTNTLTAYFPNSQVMGKVSNVQLRAGFITYVIITPTKGN